MTKRASSRQASDASSVLSSPTPEPAIVPFGAVIGSAVAFTPQLQQRPGAGLRLDVMQQPLDVFWKDEGGRSNHLCAVVMVHNVESLRKGTRAIVAPALCYENGQEVEDADEIFKIIAVDPAEVVSSGTRVSIKFRIEKVSRRKDGRKFSLRATAAPETADGSGIADTSSALTAHAFTVPITVLSKRKLSQITASPMGGPMRAPVSARKLSGVKRTSSVLQSTHLPSQQQHQVQQQQQTAFPAPPPHCPAQTHQKPPSESSAVAGLQATVAQLQRQLSMVCERVAYLERENGKRMAVDVQRRQLKFEADASPLQQPSSAGSLDDAFGACAIPVLRLDDAHEGSREAGGDAESDEVSDDGGELDPSRIGDITFDFPPLLL